MSVNVYPEPLNSVASAPNTGGLNGAFTFYRLVYYRRGKRKIQVYRKRQWQIQ